MTVVLLIMFTAAAWGLAWLALGIADHLQARRPQPRITQPVRQATPPLPVPRPRPDLPRARDIRRSRARHR